MPTFGARSLVSYLPSSPIRAWFPLSLPSLASRTWTFEPLDPQCPLRARPQPAAVVDAPPDNPDDPFIRLQHPNLFLLRQRQLLVDKVPRQLLLLPHS